ncbi:MAG: ABC transporter permease [Armatimonadetes bacterium]|nr:ABC transporter permease [Armatimonadota bacterium]
MFKNYLKIAIRNIIHYKAYSFINIVGLAIGITVFALIMVYVIGELSADKFHENIDRIYRVERQEKFGVTSIPIMERLMNALPEIENGSRLMPYPGNIKHNDELTSTRLVFVDSTFFDIFSFEAVAGDLTTALDDKQSMIIKESYAKELLGDENPVGQEIIFRDESFTITAVLKDLDQKTQLQTSDLMGNFLKLRDFGEDFENDWWGNYVTYIMLPEGMEPAYLQEKLDAFNAEMKEIVHENYPEHWFNPFKDIYFELGKFDYSVHGNILTVKMFLASAILIILIACINFINLSTARAMVRAKEIGVRKVIGANRTNLIAQFLGEAVLLCIIAGILSLVLIELAYPHFAEFFTLNAKIHSANNYLLFGGGILSIGLLSGIYPAFYLAASIPVEVLRSEQTRGNKGAAFRKILTVFQFAISIILVAGTLIVQKQLHYIQNRDLGFNKEQIISFRIPSECHSEKRDTFKQEILSIAGVKDAAYLYTTPGRVILQYGYTDPEGELYQFRTIPTDPNFIDVFEIPLVTGENWSWDLDRHQGIIVNEAFVEMMGWEDPLEEVIWGDIPIRGVMKNFIYRSLHFGIEPLALIYDWDQTHSMSVKLDGTDLPTTIKLIEEKYDKFEEKNTFNSYFLDDDFETFYRNEIRFGRIFGYFSLLAIIVACLGLFGLASFLTTQRTKEIGVRKVLGASVGQIIKNLSFDFVKWVIVANVIAWPVCWYIMNNWLQKFSFHTTINIFVFLTAGTLAIFIALITVIFHTYRAASSNPVEVLKYE